MVLVNPIGSSEFVPNFNFLFILALIVVMTSLTSGFRMINIGSSMINEMKQLLAIIVMMVYAGGVG